MCICAPLAEYLCPYTVHATTPRCVLDTLVCVYDTCVCVCVRACLRACCLDCVEALENDYPWHGIPMLCEKSSACWYVESFIFFFFVSVCLVPCPFASILLRRAFEFWRDIDLAGILVVTA